MMKINYLVTMLVNIIDTAKALTNSMADRMDDKVYLR